MNSNSDLLMDIKKLPFDENQPKVVSKLLKEMWYLWFYTDLNFATPLTKVVRKKIIPDPPSDDGGGPVQFSEFY